MANLPEGARAIAGVPTGIGIQFSKTGEPGPFTIQGVTAGGSAELCGLIAVGDLLHGVGDKPVYDFNEQQTTELILGPAGSDISLWISRAWKAGEPPQPVREVKLKRNGPCGAAAPTTALVQEAPQHPNVTPNALLYRDPLALNPKTRKRMAIFLAVVAVVFLGLFATEVVPMWGMGIAVGCVFLSGFVGVCLTPRVGRLAETPSGVSFLQRLQAGTTGATVVSGAATNMQVPQGTLLQVPDQACILCGCGESGNARPFVQDNSEYPEGLPDAIMALPLCRACLRKHTDGEPCCVCLGDCKDPTTGGNATTLWRRLRVAAQSQVPHAAHVHRDVRRDVFDATRLAIGNEVGAAKEEQQLRLIMAAAAAPAPKECCQIM